MEGVTQEEISKLSKAMKDDQFKHYMDEYCKETSDPAHRKEYLQYLYQLEAKGEMPDGQALLRTKPGCCVKTNISFKNGQTQKCFINIVHTEQLDDFRIDTETGGGRKVHLPYSLSPPRPDRDHKEEYCMTCDMAVSSYTYFQSVQQPQIMKMLVDTAADGLGSRFLKGFEEVKKDYKVMQRLQCKGGQPMPMSVSREQLKDKGKSLPKPRAVEGDAVTPSELKQMRSDIKKKKSAEEAQEERQAVEREAADERARRPPKIEDAAPRIRVPTHRLVHSGSINLTDFMETDSMKTMSPITTVPKTLKLIVELPTVKKVSDVSLDVTSYNVCVEVDGKYYLDLPLPYEIEESAGAAKFDKVKQVLTLELPVRPKAPDPELTKAARLGILEEIGGDNDGAVSEGHGSDEELLPLEVTDEAPPTPAQPPAAESAPANDQLPAEEPSARLPPAQRLEGGAAGGGLLIPAALEASQSQLDDRGEGGALVEEEAEDVQDFIASGVYDGTRPGMVFKTGDEGLGYYRDVRAPRKQARRLSFQHDPEPEMQAVVASDGPFVTEIVPCSEATRSAGSRAPLPTALRRYVDETSTMRTHLTIEDVEDATQEPAVEWHQTRQNLVLLLGVPLGHEAAGVSVRLIDRRLVLAYCTRPALTGTAAECGWCRHCLRRVLFGLVDLRQWHAEVEVAEQGSNDVSLRRRLVIVLRKVHQAEPAWPDAFDASPPVPTALEVVAPAAEALDQIAAVGSYPSAADAASLRGARADTSGVAIVGGGGSNASATSAGGAASRPAEELVDMGALAEDSAALDAAEVVVATAGAARGCAGPALSPEALSAGASAVAQSAAVLGQSVLLRSRMMYQLL